MSRDLANDNERMTKTVVCRLSPADEELFGEKCEKLGISRSAYLRYLIRVPVDVIERGGRCVVLDRLSLVRISRELTKWGYHYNQAVHALNSIALYIDRPTNKHL